MTASCAEPIQRLRCAKAKIVCFSELLSTLLSIFFWLQGLQRVTKETKEHKASSGLQSLQTSPENCEVGKNDKGLKITENQFHQQVVVPGGSKRSSLQQEAKGTRLVLMPNGNSAFLRFP